MAVKVHVTIVVVGTVLCWGCVTCFGVPELNFEYHSYADLKQYLENISEAYPNLTRLYSIGKSVQKQKLLVLEISAAPADQLGVPNVKLVGGIHGNEPVGTELILHFIQFLLTQYSYNQTVQWFVNNTRIHLLPRMNPDGFKRARFSNCTPNDNGRHNTRNVDLNRNFPDHFRKNTLPVQVEITAVREWLKATPFILSASLHGGALVANYPFDNTKEDIGSPVAPSDPSITPDDDVFRHLANVYASTHPTMHKGLPCPGEKEGFKNGIVNGASWYRVTGGMQDYNYVWHGCLELTLEISCCKYPSKDDLPMYWEQNKEAMFAFVREVHRGIQGMTLDCETETPIPGTDLVIDGRSFHFNSSKKGEYWRILLPGNYSVNVSAEGYKSYSTSFVVKPQGEDELPRMTWLDIYLVSQSSNETCKKNADFLLKQTTTTPYVTTARTEIPTTTTERLVTHSSTTPDSDTNHRSSRAFPQQTASRGDEMVVRWLYIVLSSILLLLLKCM
ncbi:carboxypeptidase D [Anabrus simplex]|uniref:carboxypeptidase D n=1 Tax=Anabrus simplex TaxID=316456 RepID=UPI0035A30582